MPKLDTWSKLSKVCAERWPLVIRPTTLGRVKWAFGFRAWSSKAVASVSDLKTYLLFWKLVCSSLLAPTMSVGFIINIMLLYWACLLSSDHHGCSTAYEAADNKGLFTLKGSVFNMIALYFSNSRLAVLMLKWRITFLGSRKHQRVLHT